MLDLRRPAVLVVKFLSSVALIASIAWSINSPGYEPAIAIVTSLMALVASWRSSEKSKHRADQNQVIGKQGFGIQAGGDVKIGDIKQREGDAE